MTLEIIDRQMPTSEDFTPEMADRQAIGTALDKNLLRSHSKPYRVYAGANDVLSWYWNINAGRAASVAQMPREDQLVQRPQVFRRYRLPYLDLAGGRS
jgi:hypothetical protein